MPDRREEIVKWLTNSELVRNFKEGKGFYVPCGQKVRLKGGETIDVSDWLKLEGIADGTTVAGYNVVYVVNNSKYQDKISFFDTEHYRYLNLKAKSPYDDFDEALVETWLKEDRQYRLECGEFSKPAKKPVKKMSLMEFDFELRTGNEFEWSGSGLPETIKWERVDEWEICSISGLDIDTTSEAPIRFNLSLQDSNYVLRIKRYFYWKDWGCCDPENPWEYLEDGYTSSKGGCTETIRCDQIQEIIELLQNDDFPLPPEISESYSNAKIHVSE